MDRRDFIRATAAVAATSMLNNSTFAEITNVPRENWSGTYHFHTNKVFQPRTAADVAAAIGSVKEVRALGTRHSFNGIADSTSAQISTLGLKDVQVNAAEHTVKAGGGIRLGELAEIIDKQGWALHNLPSLPHISLAGCISTATHGSGVKNGNISTAIREVEFVSADGKLHTLSRAKDADTFPGAVVALGALGVITNLTVDLHPRFDVAQSVYENLSFDQLQHNLVDIMGAAYSVSLFTHWQNNRADQVWIKRRVENGENHQLPEMFYGATLAKKKLHPAGPQMDATGCTEQGGSIGPWYERLPHFKLAFTPSSGHEIQTEYFVPLEHGYEAIRAVETLRDRITPHLIVTEVRTIAADDLWMSMAYQRPSLAIHFTWKPEEAAILDVLPAIEAKLAPFHPRPHWAKVFTLPKQEITARYPRLNDFRTLVKKYDPNGEFANDFMKKSVLA
ncbi:D-arabinono-1,4-lactone oxidase [Silvibacterium acidisoli]|uniref:D-arabinono-1,4-lactone oxidase n=1 Tax=Acidobacteriaceae bacterium ZG23-2 TaxID=2883246 RepID=UPI00406D1F0D